MSHKVAEEALLKGVFMGDELQNPELTDPREIEVCEFIAKYLDESADDKTKRLAKIEAIANLLAFERRMTELTDAELQNYSETLSDPIISDQMRKTLDACKTDERKDHYINIWARSVYIRRCAWEDHLYNGKEKPLIFQPETDSTVCVLS